MQKFMKIALDLAKKYQGKTSPNPLVGAILVKNGKIIGQGAHKQCGTPHAEVIAIKNCTTDCKGATLYVTLEPCCHYGKTPPCTDLIIKTGIKKVVAAIEDPNPIIAGKGFLQLEKAGIDVTIGICAEEARQLNEIFIKNMKSDLPFITLKSAISLDGKIAIHNGKSQWITGEKSRHRVHQLRSHYDAILVGKNTWQTDNPSLNVRLQSDLPEKHKIILMRKFDVTKHQIEQSKAYLNCNKHPLIIALENNHKNKEKTFNLRKSNIKFIFYPPTGDKPALVNLLQQLKQIGIMSIMIEGGSAINSTFADNKLVDKFHLFIAPKLLGKNGLPWVRTRDLDKILPNKIQIKSVEQLDEDTLLTAYCKGE